MNVKDRLSGVVLSVLFTFHFFSLSVILYCSVSIILTLVLQYFTSLILKLDLQKMSNLYFLCVAFGGAIRCTRKCVQLVTA